MSAATILSTVNTPNSPILISPNYHTSVTSKIIGNKEEFEANLGLLSESYKNIPNDLIVSLLESVSNDLSKAQYLIKQISDASTSNITHKKRCRPDFTSDIDIPLKKPVFTKSTQSKEQDQLSNKLIQLRKIQKVLTKVVVNQFEKLNNMQMQNTQLINEQNILKQQTQQLQQELQQSNQKNTVLSYMISTLNSTQSFAMDHNRPIY